MRRIIASAILLMSFSTELFAFQPCPAGTHPCATPWQVLFLVVLPSFVLFGLALLAKRKIQRVALPTLMSLFALFFCLLQAHRSATPVVLGSQRSVPEGRRSMRLPGRSCFSLAACAGGFLSGAQPTSGALFRPALARTPIIP